MNRGFLTAAVLLLAGAEALAQGRYGYQGGGQGQGGLLAGGIGARYRHWTPELEGDIETKNDGIGGSNVSLDDIGLEGEETASDIGLWLPNLPFLGQLHIQRFTASWEGDATPASNFTYGKSTFAGGMPVDSTQDWEIWTALWEYGAPMGGGSSAFTGQAGLKYIRFKTEVDGTGLSGQPISEDAGMSTYAPVFGMAFDFPLLSFLALHVEANGTRLIGLSGVEGTLIDAAAAVHIRVSNFWVGAGWRWFKLDVQDDSPKGADELELDVELKGFFFEGGFRF